MSDKADAYMHGWKAGYHNAKMAERKRIIEIIHKALAHDDAKNLEQQIKQENNELRG